MTSVLSSARSNLAGGFKEISAMSRFMSLAIVVVLFAGNEFSFGQEIRVKERAAASEAKLELPSSLEFSALLAPQCFQSGSGLRFLRVCVTERGNISHFESPAGKVHIGSTREG